VDAREAVWKLEALNSLDSGDETTGE
jgi:hypothetical protein